MRALRKRFGSLDAVHWAWLHAKAALAVWAVLLVIFTPVRVQSALGDILVWSIASITVLGALIASVGLVLSVPDRATGKPTRQTVRGFGIEMFGLLWMLIGGLVSYTGIQFALAASGDDQRIALTAFSYAYAASFLARIITIVRRRRRHRLYVEAAEAAEAQRGDA